MRQIQQETTPTLFPLRPEISLDIMKMQVLESALDFPLASILVFADMEMSQTIHDYTSKKGVG